MDIYKLRWTALERDLFSLLCQKAGEQLSQRELSKLLKVSPTAIAHSLKKFIGNHLIKVKKTKTAHFVSLNQDDQRAIELKRVENLKNVYVSGLSDYLEKELAGATVILFGSYSRGEDTTTSDMDVAVIGRTPKLLSLESFERILGRKINVNFYRSWRDIQPHLKNNILNGILLHGGVEL